MLCDLNDEWAVKSEKNVLSVYHELRSRISAFSPIFLYLLNLYHLNFAKGLFQKKMYILLYKSDKFYTLKPFPQNWCKIELCLETARGTDLNVILKLKTCSGQININPQIINFTAPLWCSVTYEKAICFLYLHV